MAIASTRRILRWGVVGCGDIVEKRVARAISDHPCCELIAAHRRDGQRLHRFCSAFGVPRAHVRFDDMVHDPDIDVLYVATPVACHAEQTIAGLEHGKHVLVEKPMAMSIAECDAMIMASQKFGRQLGVAYYRRFYPHVVRIQNAIQAQELGDLLTIYCQTGNGFPYRDSDLCAWRLDAAIGGGGPLMDIGSHRLDLMNALAGTPQTVTAACTNPGTHYGVESCATVLVTYPHGVHGILQCYFSAGHIPDEMIVTGSRGRVVAKPLNSGHLRWEVGDRTWEETLPVDPNLHAPLIRDFVRALIEGSPLAVTGIEGRSVNAMIQQAYAASAALRPPAAGVPGPPPE